MKELFADAGPHLGVAAGLAKLTLIQTACCRLGQAVLKQYAAASPYLGSTIQNNRQNKLVFLLKHLYVLQARML